MPLSKAYSAPNRANVEALIEYFNKISGKQLTLTCIRNNVFKTNWGENHQRQKDRCEIQAASIYLQEIIKNDYGGSPYDTVKTVIADVTPIVERVAPEDFKQFLHHSTNILPSIIHFDFSESLFYNNKLPDKRNDRYQLDLLVIYSLRLSLESRILGFLGIDFIEQQGKPIGFSNLYPIIKSLVNIEYNLNINWDEIQMVNVWLNQFMHRHFRPFPWTIHQVFEVIKPLFEFGEIDEGGTKHSSIYASTIVRDEKSLEEEIEQKIRAQFTGAKIQWAHQREILKTNPL